MPSHISLGTLCLHRYLVGTGSPAHTYLLNSARLLFAADYRAVSRIENELARKLEMQECHERGAERLLNLCFANSGVYIKFAQHIGQLVRPSAVPFDQGSV